LGQYTIFTSIYAFVPLYALQLGTSPAQLGVVTALFQGCGTLASLGVAPLARRTGEKVVVAIGMLLIAAGTLAVPFTRDINQLIMSQALSGVGRGLVIPTLMALSIKKKSAHEQGAAMGFFQSIYDSPEKRGKYPPPM
jgi:MFS family permease